MTNMKHLRRSSCQIKRFLKHQIEPQKSVTINKQHISMPCPLNRNTLPKKTTRICKECISNQIADNSAWFVTNGMLMCKSYIHLALSVTL